MNIQLSIDQKRKPITLNVQNAPKSGGGFDYNKSTNKPQINGVELVGNKTPTELGISGVEVVDEIRAGDMRAVTSNAVSIGVGNIEALLNTI